MDENDFSKFGQSICDTVTDAVNSAMESMDFFRIKRENFIDSRSYHAGDGRSIYRKKMVREIKREMFMKRPTKKS